MLRNMLAFRNTDMVDCESNSIQFGSIPPGAACAIMTAKRTSVVPLLTDTVDKEGAGTGAGVAAVEASVASPAALRCVKVIALSLAPSCLLL
jgi:hypothetical protein